MPDATQQTKSDTKAESGINIVNTLSLLIVGGYMVAMPLWMWWPPEVKPEVLAIINQMMGAWSIAFGGVLQYHFGSSRSSKDAQQATRDTLSTLSSTVATTAQTAAVVAASGAPVPAAIPDEQRAWDEAVTANTKVAFESYIQRFPAGAHVVEANSRIAALSNP